MIYIFGIIVDINKEEFLEQFQDNKFVVVCEKIEFKKDEKFFDIGCGWGIFVCFVSVNYGVKIIGIIFGCNQIVWGNKVLCNVGIFEDQSKILCMDYCDIFVFEGGYSKIICLEMVEYVGVCYFYGFFKQVYNMFDDDGIFFLQIVGFCKYWQFEDFIWGFFMNKYIFFGVDVFIFFGWFVDCCEGVGFEVKSVDIIGVYYFGIFWRWYRNWMVNQDKVVVKYGKRWFCVSL